MLCRAEVAGDKRGGSEGISRHHSSKAVLITASLWTRRFTTLKALGNSSSARGISFGSPMPTNPNPEVSEVDDSLTGDKFCRLANVHLRISS